MVAARALLTPVLGFELPDPDEFVELMKEVRRRKRAEE